MRYRISRAISLTVICIFLCHSALWAGDFDLACLRQIAHRERIANEPAEIDLHDFNAQVLSGQLKVVPTERRNEFLKSELGQRFTMLKAIYYQNDLDVVEDPKSGLWYMVLMGPDAERRRSVRGIRSVLKYTVHEDTGSWEDVTEEYIVIGPEVNSFDKNAPRLRPEDKVALIDLYHGPTADTTAYHPFGISLLFTVLYNSNIPVRLMPAFKSDANTLADFSNAEENYLNFLLDIIEKQGIKVIGCSVHSASYSRTKKFLQKARKRFGDKITIVLGGPAITSLAISDHKVFNGYSPWNYLVDEQGRALADILVVGPGHETVADLFKLPLKRVRGIQYCADGRVITTSLRDYPDWNFGGPLAVAQMLEYYPDKSISLASVLTERTCPYSCSYCEGQRSLTLSLASPKKDKKQVRDLSLVMEDIWRYYQAGTTEFFIQNPTFTTDVKHMEAFARALERDNRIYPLVRDGKIKFTSFGHIDDFITSEKAERRIAVMRRIGLTTLRLGIESVYNINEKRGRSTHRPALDYMEDIKNTLKLLAANGIESMLLTIIGFPGETSEQAEMTINFINELTTQPQAYNAYSGKRCAHSYETPMMYMDQTFIDKAGARYPEEGLVDYPTVVLADAFRGGNCKIAPGVTVEKHILANLALIPNFEFDEAVGNQYYGESLITLSQMLHLSRKILNPPAPTIRSSLDTTANDSVPQYVISQI